MKKISRSTQIILGCSVLTAAIVRLMMPHSDPLVGGQKPGSNAQYEFAPPGYGFSVTFPGLPTATVREGTHWFEYRDSGASYSVAVAHYGAMDSQLLEQIRDDLVGKGKVVTWEDVTLAGGHPGKKLTAQLSDDGQSAFGSLWLVGNLYPIDGKVYQVYYRSQLMQDEHGEKFLASFRLQQEDGVNRSQ